MKKILLLVMFPLCVSAQSCVEFEMMGTQAFEDGDYYKAYEWFSKAIEIDSKYALAYLNRGITGLKLDKYESAKRDFLKSIKLEPKATIAKRAYARINGPLRF